MAAKKKAKGTKGRASKAPDKQLTAPGVPQTVGDMTPKAAEPPPSGYADLLEDLKGRIRQARAMAGLAVNQEFSSYTTASAWIWTAATGKGRGGAASSTGSPAIFAKPSLKWKDCPLETSGGCGPSIVPTPWTRL